MFLSRWLESINKHWHESKSAINPGGTLVPSIFKFWKKIHFQPFFLVKILAFKTQIFQIFVPKTPHFSRKIRSLDPTFGNPCGTHQSKKVECPPGQITAFTETCNVVLGILSYYPQKYMSGTTLKCQKRLSFPWTPAEGPPRTPHKLKWNDAPGSTNRPILVVLFSMRLAASNNCTVMFLFTINCALQWFFLRVRFI